MATKEWTRRYELLSLGMWADTVLDICGKPHNIVILGRDDDGMVVEWIYPGFKLTIARAKNDDVEVYAVQKKEEIDDHKPSTTRGA